MDTSTTCAFVMGISRQWGKQNAENSRAICCRAMASGAGRSMEDSAATAGEMTDESVENGDGNSRGNAIGSKMAGMAGISVFFSVLLKRNTAVYISARKR